MTVATYTDESALYAIIGLLSLFVTIMIPLLAWIKLGGWPEGTYRIFRIPYFSAIFIDAGRTPRRYPKRLSDLKVESPDLPMFFKDKTYTNSLGRYYTNPKIATRHNGRDSWYYYPDNPFPIPVPDWTAPITISAQKLEDDLNEETMRQFLGIGDPRKNKKPSHLLRNVGIGIVAFIGFLIVITIYFGSVR